MNVTLASGSESRRRLLAGAGIDARAIKPGVDEDMLKAAMRANEISIRDQAMQLAEMKAMKISQREQGLVIGADQMLSLGSRAFDKPTTVDDAGEHLRALSGQTHRLETAIVVCENGAPVWRHLARPALTMRTLSEAFISTYLSKEGDAILSTVGGYRLEGLGVQLFSSIEGDYFSILGLPLIPLLEYFRTRQVIET